MSIDGLSDLIEPVVEKITDAVPDNILGCNPFSSGDDTNCIGNLMNISVGLEDTGIDGLELPYVTVGDFDLKLPDEIVSIIKGLTDIIPTLKDDIVDLFDDLECGRFETFRFDMIDIIRDDLLNMTKEEFPLPSCPINIKICTDIQLPRLDTFLKSTSDSLKSIIPNFDTSPVSEDVNGGRRLQVQAYCGTKNHLTGRPWEGGIKIPIPVGTLLKRSNNQLMKLFKLIDKKLEFKLDRIKLSNSRLLSKIVQKLIFKGEFLKSAGMNLFIGCDGGNMAISIGFGRFISFKVQGLSSFRPSRHAKKTIRYLEESKDKKPDMKKLNEEVERAELLKDMYCGECTPNSSIFLSTSLTLTSLSLPFIIYTIDLNFIMVTCSMMSDMGFDLSDRRCKF